MVTLRLKVGPKGQILIPKLLRDRYGLQAGGAVLVEPRDDGLLLHGRSSPDQVLASIDEHVRQLRAHGVRGPRLGDLRAVYLEREFEEPPA